jgi:uncharacterized membrane protein YhaH (DUF805 family)
MEEYKICPNCQAKLEAQAAFCNNCGTNVRDVPVQGASTAGTTGVTTAGMQAYPQSPELPRGPHYYDRPEVTWKDQYFSFKGRLNRKPYFLRGLTLSVVNIVLAWFSQTFIDNSSSYFIGIFGNFFMAGLYFIVFWSSISLAARRCHDRNHSGWWMLIPFYCIFLLFGKGDEGPNDYGPNPLAGDK